MAGSRSVSPLDRLQARLLILGGVFLLFNALALTLAPGVRERSTEIIWNWRPWGLLLLWSVLAVLCHHVSIQRLPERDPYLLPLSLLLSGWGTLAILRLSPTFGLRQAAWLALSSLLVAVGMYYRFDINLLRRYKYVWLTSGLVLAALTLFFGVNPMGAGQRLWLGCCGMYLQPSEPLKLLLVVYLAAYLADWRLLFGRQPAGIVPRQKNARLLAILAPTLVMYGLALALMVVQRDLGTASIFLFLYATIVFLGSGKASILWASLVATVASAAAGYVLFDVVRLRIDAWLNPWLDPSGRSYQIVQSLLAIANGGIFGRGLGMGSPGLVPVPHSDFIFSSICEESGLLGALALLGLLALFANRGLRVALHAPDLFQRFLAAGLTAHLVGQSILIIGGNVRLLPLTGVTLPFVSYGGSSLLVCFIELFLLLAISGQNSAGISPSAAPAGGSASPAGSRPYLILGLGLYTGLAAAMLLCGWWAVYRGPALLIRTDNARRSIADRYVQRGSLLARDGQKLAETQGEPGSYLRRSLYQPLSPILGYIDPVYGQSGLEASLDRYLRGLEGQPAGDIWKHHLLYGQPPPGLDVRLSLDLSLQQIADQLLEGRRGALVLLNAENGDVLAIASHPYFDANRVAEQWPTLVADPAAPLLNRATLGLYPTGSALGPLLLAAAFDQTLPADQPQSLSFSAAGQIMDCALPGAAQTWGAAIANGCPGANTQLGQALGALSIRQLYQDLGLFRAPLPSLPAPDSPMPFAPEDAALEALGLRQGASGLEPAFRVNPLQMALAAAALSAAGSQPAPRLALAIRIPQADWQTLPLSRSPEAVLSKQAVAAAVLELADADLPIWHSITVVGAAADVPGQGYTWLLAGTLPSWPGSPLTLALIIEENEPAYALMVGQAIFQTALQP